MKRILLAIVLVAIMTPYLWGADVKITALPDAGATVATTSILPGVVGGNTSRFTAAQLLALKTSVSGNAGTATALAANGANCNAGSAPLGVDASGAVEGCFAVQADMGITAKSDSTSTTSSTTAASSTAVKAAYDLANGRQVNLDLAKGTLTNTYLCTYTAAGTLLSCNTNPATFQAALTYPVTGIASPTAGYLTKWGASGNTLADGPKIGTFTDAKWCSFSTANGLQCTETAPGAGSFDITSITGQTDDTTPAATATAALAQGGSLIESTVQQIVDAGLAAPAAIGTGTPAAGTFTSVTIAKQSGVAGLSAVYEANSTDTSYIGQMGPASITESFSYQYSNTQPSGSIPIYAAPAGSGDPNGQKVSAQTWVTPGTGVATALAANANGTGGFVVVGNAAGASSVLTGLTGAAGALSESDTILQAFGKLIYQLTLSDGQVLGRYGSTIGGLAIDSDLSSVSTNNDTVPSAKATKAYADGKIGGTYGATANTIGKRGADASTVAASGIIEDGTNVSIGALNLVSTGIISGGIKIASDADGMTAANMIAADPSTTGLYGTMFIATGNGTWILPDVAAAGQSACLMDSGTAHDLILDVTAGSTIRLKGTEQADGVGITNAAGTTTGDFVCVISVAAHKWSTVGMGGAWVSQ